MVVYNIKAVQDPEHEQEPCGTLNPLEVLLDSLGCSPFPRPKPYTLNPKPFLEDCSDVPYLYPEHLVKSKLSPQEVNYLVVQYEG